MEDWKNKNSEEKSWFYFSGVVSCVWFDSCCDSSSGLLAGRLNLDPSGSAGICSGANTHLGQSSARKDSLGDQSWEVSAKSFSPTTAPTTTTTPQCTERRHHPAVEQQETPVLPTYPAKLQHGSSTNWPLTLSLLVSISGVKCVRQHIKSPPRPFWLYNHF